MNTKKYTIGIDIGGSHISCTAMDMQEKRLLSETFVREHLSHTDTAENIFKAWAKAINACVEKVGGENVEGLGFAIPGPFNYKEGISMMEHKYPALFQKHIPTELQKFLTHPQLPMRFLNDASAFAVGVSWIDAGKGHERVVVLTLGTGFGSAYIREGIPVISGENIAPEGCFWHIPFKEGIADEYFSTRWFTNTYEQRTGKPIKGVKEVLDTEISEELFTEFGNNLGEFVAPWLNRFQADILVMGGNISLAFSQFEQVFKQKLSAEGISVKVAVSSLMEDAAMVGAARLFEPEFWEKIKNNLPNI